MAVNIPTLSRTHAVAALSISFHSYRWAGHICRHLAFHEGFHDFHAYVCEVYSGYLIGKVRPYERGPSSRTSPKDVSLAAEV